MQMFGPLFVVQFIVYVFCFPFIIIGYVIDGLILLRHETKKRLAK